MTITPDYSPALGDLRACGGGMTIHIMAGATSRPDWSRIAAAIADAVTKGANVIHITPTERGA